MKKKRKKIDKKFGIGGHARFPKIKVEKWQVMSRIGKRKTK